MPMQVEIRANKYPTLLHIRVRYQILICYSFWFVVLFLLVCLINNVVNRWRYM